MEKLTLALATLGLTTSLGVFASTPTGVQPFQVTVPDIKAGFDFTLTGLYLQPTASDSQLFYTRTYSDGAFTDHSVEPDYSPAFGLGIGYAFKNSGNDMRLNWTHLNSSDDANVNASGSFGVGTPLDATSGNVKFKYDAVDLDFGQYLNIGTRLQTRWFAGARFAQITQDQTSTFAIVTGTTPPSNVQQATSKFTGIGPRLGVDGNYYLGNNMGFVTQLAASLLVGNTESNTVVTNSYSIDNPSQSRVVPALDGKLGFDYSKAIHNGGRFTLEAGYQISEYFNALDRTSNSTPPILLSSPYVPSGTTSSNVGFQGPYLSVKYKV